MKKLLALILALVLAMSVMVVFTGCEKDVAEDEDTSVSDKADAKDDEEEEEEEVTIVGEWEAEVSLLKAAEAGGAEMPEEMLEYFDFESVNMVMKAEFSEDGEFEMELDTDGLIDDVIKVMKKGMEKYLEAMIEENGMDMTVDEVIEAQGYDSLDEYIDEVAPEAFPVDDIKDQTTFEGYYEIDDDEIALTEEEGEASKSDFTEFELTSKKLTIDLGDEMFGELEFKRVK